MKNRAHSRQTNGHPNGASQRASAGAGTQASVILDSSLLTTNTTTTSLPSSGVLLIVGGQINHSRVEFLQLPLEQSRLLATAPGNCRPLN